MVSNPFSEGASVRISSDTSGFTSGIDGAMSKLGGFKTAVGAAGLALGALAAGGLAASINAARDFEEAVVELEKVTNADVAAGMADSIKDMATEIPQAQEDLADIAATAGRLGVEGTENIERFTRVTAEIVTATDLAADEAADSFARIATLTDEPIENIRSLGDVVNELSNTMGASASEIVNAMTRSAGALSQLGVASEDIAALNAAMNEVSSSSRIAGTRLRRFSQEITDPGKVEDLASALGMSVEEFKTMRSESPVELMRQMAEAFGEGGETADQLRSVLSTTSRATLAGLSQNLDGLADAQASANEQMEEGGSLTEEFEAANSTFNAELQRTRNQLRNVAITTGEQLLPVAGKLLGRFSDILDRFTKFNERTNGMAGAITLISSLFTGLVAAVATVIPMLGGVSAITAGLGTAFTVLTGPVGIAIAAITALAIAWTSNLFGIQEKTQTAFTRVSAIFQQTLTHIEENVVGPVLSRLTKVWELHGSEISAELGETMDAIQSAISSALNFIMPFVESALNMIREFWSVFGEDIVTLVKVPFRAITEVFAIFFDAFLTSFQIFLNILQGDWGEAFTLLRDFVVRTFNNIAAFIKDVGPTIVDAVISIGESVFGVFKDLYNDLIGNSLIPDMINDIANFIEGNGLSMMVGAVTTFISTVLAVYESGFNRIFNMAMGVFESLVTGVNEGLDILPDKITSKLGFDVDGGFSAPRRETDIGALQQQRESQINQVIEVVVEGDTDVVRQTAARVVDQEGRQTRRQQGAQQSPTR